jgi:hypothetical protein
MNPTLKHCTLTINAVRFAFKKVMCKIITLERLFLSARLYQRSHLMMTKGDTSKAL